MVVMVLREYDGQSRLLTCRDLDSPRRPTLGGCFQKGLAEGGRLTLKVGFWAPRLSGGEKGSGTPALILLFFSTLDTVYQPPPALGCS